VTETELEELLSDCPTLYHMAEDRSWPSIRHRGLLSTTALLDLYGVKGAARVHIEERRRPASVPLDREGRCGASPMLAVAPYAYRLVSVAESKGFLLAYAGSPDKAAQSGHLSRSRPHRNRGLGACSSRSTSGAHLVMPDEQRLHQTISTPA